jgi:ankyrin repeat protein
MSTHELSPEMRGFVADCHRFACERNLLALQKLIADESSKLAHDNDPDVAIEVTLIMAIETGDVQLARALLDIGAPTDGKDYRDLGFPPLYYAIAEGKANADLIRLLLSRGANANIRMVNDETPLHLAIQHDNIEAVKALLEFGADPCAATRIDFYYPPLMKASAQGKLEIMRLLLDAGADPAYKNPMGESAETVAAKRSREEVKQLLAAVGHKKRKIPRKSSKG